MKCCKRKFLKEETQYKYKATDVNGWVYYYTSKPKINSTFYCWLNSGNGKCSFVKTKNNYKKNWKKSLRRIVD